MRNNENVRAVNWEIGDNKDSWTENEQTNFTFNVEDCVQDEIRNNAPTRLQKSQWSAVLDPG